MVRILLVSLAGLLSGCDGGAAVPADSNLVQSLARDPEALARGKALYLGTCAALCHGLPSDADAFLFDCEWSHGGSDDEIFAVITNGIPDTRMVGFGNNFPEGDDDKWKIIAFLRANQQPCG